MARGSTERSAAPTARARLAERWRRGRAALRRLAAMRWWTSLGGGLRTGARIAIATAALLALLLAVIDVAVDRPLRAHMERRLNERLQGYQVQVRAADFHVLGFGLDLEDVIVIQTRNPDPPVARLPRIGASVQWRALLSGRVVADIEFDRPVVHIDRRHVTTEARDPVPATERGWQDALQALYPFKINLFRVFGGAATYVDDDRARPLELTDIEFRADNIRNIRSPERTYPSELDLDATVFETGRLRLVGHADFLAKPHAGVQGDLELEDIPLDYIEPVARRYNIRITGGTLSAAAAAEYAASIRSLQVRRLAVDGLRAEYVHRAATAPLERRRVQQARRAAAEVSNEPELLLRIDAASMSRAVVGFVNRAQRPPYRLFLDGARLEASNLSNQRAEGESVVRLRGKFMGSGDLDAVATFRPHKKGPDFDLAVRIEGTEAKTMNDLLRAHGGFDVVAGTFSLYSELSAQDGIIRGYVKPFFQNLDVYDARQDREKGVLRKIYERLVGGLAELLENRPREQVATKADVWGRIEDPRKSTLQIIAGLIHNAFFKAILPRFEREADLVRRRR
jgi:hypothetical protein